MSGKQASEEMNAWSKHLRQALVSVNTDIMNWLWLCC